MAGLTGPFSPPSSVRTDTDQSHTRIDAAI